jgi:hypothetical protein
MASPVKPDSRRQAPIKLRFRAAIELRRSGTDGADKGSIVGRPADVRYVHSGSIAKNLSCGSVTPCSLVTRPAQ